MPDRLPATRIDRAIELNPRNAGLIDAYTCVAEIDDRSPPRFVS